MVPSIFGESLFDDFFGNDFEKHFFGSRDPLYGKHAKNLMKTDVKEGKDCYKVSVDLPGFKKEDVSVELQDGYLTISASKGLDKDEKDEEGRFIRQERYSGACTRSFYVGDLKPEDIQCKYEFGVLKLRLPKVEQKALESQKKIAIQ